MTLNPIHIAKIRIATCPYKSSPIDSLFCEVSIPPLKIRQKFLTLKYAVKNIKPSNTAKRDYLEYTPQSFVLIYEGIN